MMKSTCLALLATSLCATCASAAEQRVSLLANHTDYTEASGKRDLQGLEYVAVTDRDTWVVSAGAGRRQFGDGQTYRGNNVSGTYYRKWSPVLATRSNVATSSNAPVFARRVLDQDVTYTGLNNTALTAGVRRTRYYGAVDANAWYVGGAYYLRRLTLRYRYTHQDIKGLGTSQGNLLSFRLKDARGAGSTQLWLGKGSTPHDYDWSSVLQVGNQQSISLRRVQPLSESISLSASIERTDYKTPSRHYDGMTSALGLTYSW